jgi:hypothetical protein
MSSESGSGGVRWGVLACRMLGLAIFVVAFFLSAVRSGPPGDFTAIVYPGYKCAMLALSETASLFGKTVSGRPPLPAYMLAISGWLNPLIVIDLALSFWRGALLARRIVLGLAIVCMAAAWTFFVEETLAPLIGHFLWVAGALLIVVPDALPARGTKRA